MINVLIADDHSMIREGLKQLLELDGNIKVIAEANDGLECLECINRLHPDVVLLDINMPNMNGLQVLEHLRNNNKKVKVLVLTIHNEIEYLVRAVEIGVAGYLLKDSDSSVLKKAIQTVYDGETFIQPSLTPLLKERMANPDILTEADMLTKREIDVLKLVAEGRLNRDIANTLQISEKTVKNHVSNIFKKIHVNDRTQAAVYAIKNNFVKI